MKLNQSQIQDLTYALADAFSQDELARLLSSVWGLSPKDFVHPNQTLLSTNFQVIEYANSHGIIDNLIRAITDARPKNPRLRAMLERLGAAADTSGLEQVVRDTSPFTDIQVWRTRLGELERRVCRVEVGGQEGSPATYGTGFLVAPNAVMTCFHVVAQVIENELGSADLRFRFDYRLAPGGTELHPGVVFSSRPTNWLLAQSSFETRGREGLDYAIILLDRLIEPDRGYISFPSNSPPVVPGMNLVIIQHPEAGPLKLAFETNGAIGLSDDNRFIRHRVATLPGSAGSPVFNGDWVLVGLHQGHWNRVSIDESGENRAIAIAAILEDLERKDVNVIDLQDTWPDYEEPSSDDVSQRLRDYRPLIEAPVQSDEPPALDAYRKAAAVLNFFDIGSKASPIPSVQVCL